jgi:hypothetical protein
MSATSGHYVEYSCACGIHGQMWRNKWSRFIAKRTKRDAIGRRFQSAAARSEAIREFCKMAALWDERVRTLSEVRK